ncbi:MAG: hypothetical protein JOZ27_08525, partial [Caulobacteraceae bacterium]|nr:hypothetical protein [Caulobacteraceae bacterium]
MPHDDNQTWDIVPSEGPTGRGEMVRRAAIFPRREDSPHLDLESSEPAGGAFTLAEYGQMLWKRRFLIASIFAVVFALGTVATLMTTPIYRASTTIQVDREAAKVLPGGADALQPAEMLTGDEFYQTQYGLLKGRFLAERVVGALHLADSESTLRALGWRPHREKNVYGPAALRARRVREAVVLVQKALRVDPVRGSRLVQISIDSRSPDLSSQIANAFADNFITSNLER